MLIPLLSSELHPRDKNCKTFALICSFRRSSSRCCQLSCSLKENSITSSATAPQSGVCDCASTLIPAGDVVMLEKGMKVAVTRPSAAQSPSAPRWASSASPRPTSEPSASTPSAITQEERGYHQRPRERSPQGLRFGVQLSKCM
jgi:hypothetical protein